MRIGNTIYLDHQATTPLDSRVFSEMSPYIDQRFGNPHSGDHALGWQAAQAVEAASRRVARLIGADSDEIIFTSGATESNNLALLGLARRAAAGSRRRVLVGALEHKCVLEIGRVLGARLGFNVEQVPVDEDGRVVTQSLEDMIDDDVLFVSIMAVNNEIGTIEDIESIRDIIRGSGAVFHCDAAQAPCALDISTFAEHVDLLSLSAHKIYGPKGVGALFVRRELQGQIEPLFYGGGQQNGLRSGTVPTPLCVGMGAAAELLGNDEALAEREAVARLRDTFVEELNRLPWAIRLNGPELGPQRHPGNANVCFEGFAAHDILGSLQPRLSASTGSACATGMPEPSHVLRGIGLSDQEAEASIRFSLGRQTTEQDVVEAVQMIGEALDNLAASGVARTG
mgnify:CR=1 FL=1